MYKKNNQNRKGIQKILFNIAHRFNKKLLVVVMMMLFPIIGNAAGPLTVNRNDPEGLTRYPDGGKNIKYNLAIYGQDTFNECGVIDDPQAFLDRALKTWADLEHSTVSFAKQENIVVTEDNFVTFLSGRLNPESHQADGLSPIIFDPDGELLSLLGFSSSVLGFASPDTYDENGFIAEGSSVIRCVDATTFGAADAEIALLETVVHEFGHFIGLGHSQVNGHIQRQDDYSGPGDDIFGVLGEDFTLDNSIEIMYPFSIPEILDATPKLDDASSLAQVYPGENFESETSTITGYVYDIDGKTPISGVNVIARNLDDPFDDATSMFSGARGEQGKFILSHLTPGARYVLYTDKLGPGGFSLPGFFDKPSVEEEFWNGDNESQSAMDDVPEEYQTIVLTPGETKDGVNFIKNTPHVADEPIAFPRSFAKDYVAVPIGFDFNFCGETFSQVTVSTQGYIGFGNHSDINFPSPFYWLNNVPRIAGLWNSFYSLRKQGSISYSSNADEFSVTFSNIATRFGEGDDPSNNFTISLYPSGFFSITYGKMTLDNGFSGYTCGYLSTNGKEEEVDLYQVDDAFSHILNDEKNQAWAEKFSKVNSNLEFGEQDHFGPFNFPVIRFFNTYKKTAIYEEFDRVTRPRPDSEKTDLSSPERDLILVFSPTRGFRDRFEPNNSIDTASYVKLPFSSADTRRKFTSIELGDVDYYHFCGGEPGDQLIVEQIAPYGPLQFEIGLDIPPRLDSLFGLFDDQGHPLVIDQDGGSANQQDISKIIYSITDESPDCYYAAISSQAISVVPKDFNFQGGGQDYRGRYVLNIDTSKGRVIAKESDEIEEIQLPFAFPFYGETYTTMFVSENGEINFGEPRSGRLNVKSFLAGPPSIAALASSQLGTSRGTNGSLGGVITYYESDDSVQVRFHNVPIKNSFERETFTITLFDDGKVSIVYENTSPLKRNDILAGVSPGGISEDIEESDLSQLQQVNASQAVYEEFEGFSSEDHYDLNGEEIIFITQ